MGSVGFALGVDYGTNSVRAIVVDVANGKELGSHIFDYRRGEAGVILDARDVNMARQHPADYIDGFYSAVTGAVKSSGVEPAAIVGIGVDTTGSTPIPVDESGAPLAMDPRFEGNPNAMAWLWKDHTGYAEAAEITALARQINRPYLDKCGGTYSSEWFWSKILRCARVAPEVFEAAHSWVEFTDFVPAYLTGTTARPKRGACAAGHKAMYHADWGGLPDAEFLSSLDPRLAALRERLYDLAVPSSEAAGGLTADVGARCGLPAGIPVAVGAFDAHMGAVGSGVKPGTLVKIMGTSTCDIMVGDASTPDIPGVCGVVPGSVIPGMMGVEAGQSAVGDLFNWGVSLLGQSHEALTASASALRPGESGLLALDWNNGNRTVLVDPLLSGLLVGQSLHTTAGEVYRALIEATAFGALTIIRRIEEFGVPVEEIVVCGGIAEKSPLAMQIYADVCGRPIKVSASAQTCALGAAIFGSVVGGAHPDTLTAQSYMVAPAKRTYAPDPDSAKTYSQLYRLYSQVHDAFGVFGPGDDVSGVMKELIAIRAAVRG